MAGLESDDSSPGRVTVGELARRLDRFEGTIGDRFDSIDATLIQMNFVHPDVLDSKLLLEAAHREDVARRVSKLEAENDQRKLDSVANRRLAISAIIGPIVVGVLVGLILWAVLGTGG